MWETLVELTDPKVMRPIKRFWLLGVATAILFSLLSVAGCAGVDYRMENAHRLARDAGLTSQILKGGSFALQTYHRLGRSTGPLRVYIEGDGFAWINRRRISPDPTPHNPVALKLAASDRSPAVFYVGRPCQYVGVGSNRQCTKRYWTSHRFAPEVIETTSAVIEQGKKLAGTTAIELVGFSGGGAVAVLVASLRSDVVGIRTVAGNLDHVTLNQQKKVTLLTGSLNAVDVATKVSGIPQVHYVGVEDDIVGDFVAEVYRNRAGRTDCIAVRRVSGVSHTEGWDDAWRDLVALPLPKCN
jgi:hypothetical protein